MKFATPLALVAAAHLSVSVAFAAPAPEPESGSDGVVAQVLLLGVLIVAGGLAQPATEAVGE